MLNRVSQYNGGGGGVISICLTWIDIHLHVDKDFVMVVIYVITCMFRLVYYSSFIRGTLTSILYKLISQVDTLKKMVLMHNKGMSCELEDVTRWMHKSNNWKCDTMHTLGSFYMFQIYLYFGLAIFMNPWLCSSMGELCMKHILELCQSLLVFRFFLGLLYGLNISLECWLMSSHGLW